MSASRATGRPESASEHRHGVCAARACAAGQRRSVLDQWQRATQRTLQHLCGRRQPGALGPCAGCWLAGGGLCGGLHAAGRQVTAGMFWRILRARLVWLSECSTDKRAQCEQAEPASAGDQRKSRQRRRKQRRRQANNTERVHGQGVAGHHFCAGRREAGAAPSAGHPSVYDRPPGGTRRLPPVSRV